LYEGLYNKVLSPTPAGRTELGLRAVLVAQPVGEHGVVEELGARTCDAIIIMSLYDSTFSRTVWRLYGGAKCLVMWY
jgi:hypothetical protein